MNANFWSIVKQRGRLVKGGERCGKLKALGDAWHAGPIEIDVTNNDWPPSSLLAVVTGEWDESTKGHWQREEDLSGSIQPYLGVLQDLPLMRHTDRNTYWRLSRYSPSVSLSRSLFLSVSLTHKRKPLYHPFFYTDLNLFLYIIFPPAFPDQKERRRNFWTSEEEYKNLIWMKSSTSRQLWMSCSFRTRP